VQGLGAIAVRIHGLDQLVDLEPRTTEDERARRTLDLEHAPQGQRLVLPRHDIGDLPHARHLARGRLLARRW